MISVVNVPIKKIPVPFLVPLVLKKTRSTNQFFLLFPTPTVKRLIIKCNPFMALMI